MASLLSSDYTTPCYNRYQPMLPPLHLHDHVRLRKPHPCGGDTWRVVRLGADLRLECLGCGRLVMLSRRELARRLKQVLPPSEDEPSSS